MDNKFFEYYGYEPKIRELDDFIIVIDANVFLNLYYLKPESFKKIISLLSGYKSRLWLPHQVGLEIHKNRLNKIGEIKGKYMSVAKHMKEDNNSLNEIVNIKEKLNLELDKEELTNYINLSEGIIRKIESMSFEFDEDINKDNILKQIITLFSEDKIGGPYTAKEQLNIIKDGEIRYKYLIPPGFKDKSKSDNIFGDLMLWNQMIDYAKINKKSIWFITDDDKKDWWLKENKKSIGLHPKLQSEFYLESNQHIWGMNSTDFFEYIDSHHKLGEIISKQWKPIISEFIKQEEERKKLAMTISLSGLTEAMAILKSEREFMRSLPHISGLVPTLTQLKLHQNLLSSLPNLQDLIPTLDALKAYKCNTENKSEEIETDSPKEDSDSANDSGDKIKNKDETE